MHSSVDRMPTCTGQGGCLPGGHLPGGLSAQGVFAQGVSAQGVCADPRPEADTPPPVDRQTPVNT